jgi:hypothetical protein
MSGLALLVGYSFVWYLFMASPARRSLRSVVFLLATTPLLGLAALARFPFGLLCGGLVAGIWLTGLWDMNHFLAPMEPDEVRFDEALGRIRRRVLVHEQRIRSEQWEQARSGHLVVLQEAITQVRALTPPAAEWALLSNSLMRTLEFDARVYRGDGLPDTTTGAASFARWEKLKREWASARSLRSRFRR